MGTTPLLGHGVLPRGRKGRRASERGRNVSLKDVVLWFVTSAENLSFYVKTRL